MSKRDCFALSAVGDVDELAQFELLRKATPPSRVPFSLNFSSQSSSDSHNEPKSTSPSSFSQVPFKSEPLAEPDDVICIDSEDDESNGHASSSAVILPSNSSSVKRKISYISNLADYSPSNGHIPSSSRSNDQSLDDSEQRNEDCSSPPPVSSQPTPMPSLTMQPSQVSPLPMIGAFMAVNHNYKSAFQPRARTSSALSRCSVSSSSNSSPTSIIPGLDGPDTPSTQHEDSQGNLPVSSQVQGPEVASNNSASEDSIDEEILSLLDNPNMSDSSQESSSLPITSPISVPSSSSSQSHLSNDSAKAKPLDEAIPVSSQLEQPRSQKQVKRPKEIELIEISDSPIPEEDEDEDDGEEQVIVSQLRASKKELIPEQLIQDLEQNSLDDAQLEDDKKQEEKKPFEIEALLDSDHVFTTEDIKKLRAAGFHTLDSLRMKCRRDVLSLTTSKGLESWKAERAQEVANRLSDPGFQTGAQLADLRQSNVIKITTGSAALDKLLGGGIESGCVTEIFGAFATGKSQLCHTLCVTCQLPYEENGGNGKVAFIDTEGTFRPERVSSIATRFGLEPRETLENVLHARAWNHEHQMSLLTKVATKMAEDQFKLLIVDSATALFRADFPGKSALMERQQKLGFFMNCLSKIAAEFDVAVLVTNQVVADINSGSSSSTSSSIASLLSSGSSSGAAVKAAGGNVMAHAATTRVQFKKGRTTVQRVAVLVDSPNLAEGEATFVITEHGIADV